MGFCVLFPSRYVFLITNSYLFFFLIIYFIYISLSQKIGFNTAVLQQHARLTKIAIDDLTFDTKVFKKYSKEIEEKITKGVIVHGFFIQGASWSIEQGRIVEPGPGELDFEMPCIHFNPIEKSKFRHHGLYKCPMYKTSSRWGELSTTGHSTNFVMYLHLKSTEEVEHWIRRGTALLTQLDS